MIEADVPKRPIAVPIPELVKTNWWQYALHTHRARRSKLLRFGGSRVVVIDLPWYLDEPSVGEGLDKDAPSRTGRDG